MKLVTGHVIVGGLLKNVVRFTSCFVFEALKSFYEAFQSFHEDFRAFKKLS